MVINQEEFLQITKPFKEKAAHIAVNILKDTYKIGEMLENNIIDRDELTLIMRASLAEYYGNPSSTDPFEHGTEFASKKISDIAKKDPRFKESSLYIILINLICSINYGLATLLLSPSYSASLKTSVFGTYIKSTTPKIAQWVATTPHIDEQSELLHETTLLFHATRKLTGNIIPELSTE